MITQRGTTTKRIETWDNWSHTFPLSMLLPRWLRDDLCDALDLACGMAKDDFGPNKPSKIAYWLSRF